MNIGGGDDGDDLLPSGVLAIKPLESWFAKDVVLSIAVRQKVRRHQI